MPIRAIPIFLAIALASGLLVWSKWQTELRVVSGVIEADEIRLGSRVGGRVKEVLVDEGDWVSRDQVLIVLDEYNLKERRKKAEHLHAQKKAEYEKLRVGYLPEEKAQAQAGLDRAEAAIQRTNEDIKAARSAVAQAKAHLERAEQTQGRLQKAVSVESIAVAQEELDRAMEDVLVARATVSMREEQLSSLIHGRLQEAEAERRVAEATRDLVVERGYRQEEIDAAKAAMLAAQQEVGIICEEMKELQIRSSVDGLVESLELQPGDLVTPNAPVLSMMDTRRLWVRAYIPQRHLDLQRGDRLRVKIDAYPDRQFQGRVSFVNRQAEFTPSNVQTYEERAKQMFRIKVVLDDVDPQIDIRPGMTADVYLD
jgi:multidrug resistance efflux pump